MRIQWKNKNSKQTSVIGTYINCDCKYEYQNQKKRIKFEINSFLFKKK